MSTHIRKPNHLLRRERELRSWTLEQAADALYELCKHEPRAGSRGDINASMISGWERGIHPPSSYYQRKLCRLYEKTPEDLGFLEPLQPPDRFPTRVSTDAQPHTSNLPAFHQAIDHLLQASASTPEELAGDWLALRASDLAVLLQEGWSIEEILTSLGVVLKGVQTLSNISRRAFGRTLLQWGAAAILSGIPIPSGRHISAEERLELHQTLGESIAAGWKLFHTAGNAQILAVGRAQLVLVQQASAYLYPSVRPMYYSGVHRLIGAALHFQGRYEEAHQAQEKAYIAALEGADSWNMAQSRGWQAYGLKEREEYLEALDTADAALRLVSCCEDTESIRLRARLLAFSAENAALLGQTKEVERRLEASENLLEYLPGAHEEFDRTSWLQQAGTCAYSLKQYDLAIERLQQALDELPAEWTLRSVSTAIPLASAFTRQKERDRALAVAEHTLPVVKLSQSPTLTRAFTIYLQEEFLTSFPKDSRCQSFVTEAQRQLTLAW